jgi:tetratricopeptide (TPR) repeat protein
MGRRDEATAYLRRLEREASPYEAGMVRGSLAVQAGDLSQAADAFAAAQDATRDLGKEAVAVSNRAVLLLSLGYVEAALGKFAECRWRWAQGRSSSLQMPEFFAAHLALQRGTLPPAERIAELNRSPRDHNARVFVREVAAKLIGLGRAAELAALYDGPDGLLGFSSQGQLPVSPQHVTRYAPTVAAVPGATGRAEEARRLLAEADRHILLALRRSRGEVPAELWAAAAKTWAMLGKQSDALTALETAVRNGWINIDSLAQDLPNDLGEEPGFAPLRGQPRFEAIRASLNNRLARERAELRPRV